MPEPKNCRKCGKMFTYISGPQICPTCSEQDEVDFKSVKEYLYENHGASMSEVSENVGVSIEKITRYLREGRLEIVNGEGNLFLACESCGKAIRSGRLCNECSHNFSSELKSAAKELSKAVPDQPAKKEVEMRFLNKVNKR